MLAKPEVSDDDNELDGMPHITLDEEIYEIAAVLDQWYEPTATYFKVQSTKGKTYLL